MVRRWWTQRWRKGSVDGGVVGMAKRSEAASSPLRLGSVPVGPAAERLGDGPMGSPSPAPSGLTGTGRFPAPRMGEGAEWGSYRWCAKVVWCCDSRCNPPWH